MLPGHLDSCKLYWYAARTIIWITLRIVASSTIWEEHIISYSFTIPWPSLPRARLFGRRLRVDNEHQAKVPFTQKHLFAQIRSMHSPSPR